jgi:hypothetical protein
MGITRRVNRDCPKTTLKTSGLTARNGRNGADRAVAGQLCMGSSAPIADLPMSAG